MSRLLSRLLILSLLTCPVAPAKAQELPPVEDKPNPPMSVILKKRDVIDSETVPALREVLNLSWDVIPEDSPSDDSKKLNLSKVLHRSMAQSLEIRQAKEKLKAAQDQADDIRITGVWDLLNPIDLVTFKKTGEITAKAAEAAYRANVQKKLLANAQLYAGLTQTFLNKYLAFQNIEQAKRQLRADQEQFLAGDSNRFNITQTEMDLLERYKKYLEADNHYHTASMALASQLDIPTDKTLVPLEINPYKPGVSTPLKLIPEDMTASDASKLALQKRPDLQELAYKLEVLKHLTKASMGAEHKQREAELIQLQLEQQKAQAGARLLAEKAYAEYHLSEKNYRLAQQQHELAQQLVHQINVSHGAGFSSTQDLRNAQGVMAKAYANYMNAEISYNMAQLQLLTELGLLNEDSLDKALKL